MRIRLDPFVLSLLSFAALGIFLPVRGTAFDYALIASEIAVMLLFFLHGFRLPTSQVLVGLGAWQVHLLILAVTFGLFPLMGLTFRFFAEGHVSALVISGIIYLTLVPSTVQAAVALTSISGGDRSIAVVAASGSSLLGVLITPLLVGVLLSQDTHIDASSVLRIIGLLFVPFLVGQVARRFVKIPDKESDSGLVAFDKFMVLFIVYIGFSSGTNAGVWESVSWPDLLTVVAVCGAMYAIAAAVSWQLGQFFGRSRQIAMFFAGTNKSLMAGLPMALVLFSGNTLGLMVLPLMIFHQLQLIVGSVLARRFSQNGSSAG